MQVVKAAKLIQLEQQQILSDEPITTYILFQEIIIPSQLSYHHLMQMEDKHIWKRGLCNELGRLAQEYRDIKGRNTFYFIPKTKVPKHK